MIERILYTAEASAQGGREGSARTSDGRLDVELDVPTEMGGSGGPGTNPEQLFAAGYAACFQSALLRLAFGRKLDLTESRVIARGPTEPSRHRQHCRLQRPAATRVWRGVHRLRGARLRRQHEPK